MSRKSRRRINYGQLEEYTKYWSWCIEHTLNDTEAPITLKIIRLRLLYSSMRYCTKSRLHFYIIRKKTDIRNIIKKLKEEAGERVYANNQEYESIEAYRAERHKEYSEVFRNDKEKSQVQNTSES